MVLPAELVPPAANKHRGWTKIALAAALVGGFALVAGRRVGGHDCYGSGPARTSSFSVVGQQGNGWTLPVGTQGVTFTVQMVQPPKTAVDEVRVLIHPRQPPGLVYGQGGPDNDPAVTRRLSVKGHWDTPGLRQFTLHWDGRDKHGHPVAKGPYLLEAVETIRSTVQVPCRDGGFGLDRTAALSGGGLGTLDVT